MKDSDAFADIYGEFFDLYNKGALPSEISKKIIEDNQEILEADEDKHNFWFALALAQWETKSLNTQVLLIVEEIISSGNDLKLWAELGASEQDINNRGKVLKKFINKIRSGRDKAKPRKRAKLRVPIFSTGDCIVFKMKNGNYGGAVVLATDSSSETASNLIATTRINQSGKPTLMEFKNSDTLILNFADWEDKPEVLWYMPDLYYKGFSGIYEVVGAIPVELNYAQDNHNGKGYLFYPSWTARWDINEIAETQFESEFIKAKPLKSISIRQLLNKKKWWQIF